MPTATLRRTSRSARAPRKPAKLSRLRKPKDMDLEDWQIKLREQFGREQPMKVRNLGGDPVFSEFSVTNPATAGTYRVVIRGVQPGVNYCSCPDYAVNTLGTCKHIEATLHRLRRRHAAALRNGYRPPFSEVYVRYGVQREVWFSAGCDCPTRLKKLAGRYFGVEGKLTAAGLARFDRFVRELRRFDHEVRICNDAAELIAVQHDDRKRQVQLQKRWGSRARSAWKKLLKVPLYPYQQEAALFAARAGRAIIADEMGLGKTIEALAATEILARECGVERVLIVCPSTLKSQWEYEIKKFSRRSALVIEGLTHQRQTLYQQAGAFFKIVNYDVVHRDLDAIAKWAPDVVILDEAQRIKNWQTRTAKSIKRLTSRYVLVLTGTPLENRIEELHSIVEFVDCHHLGPLFAFKAAHEIYEEDSSKVVGYQHLDRIHKTLSPILIRRTKKQVLDQLPPRMDKNFFVPMTEPQWVPHEENREIVARIVAKWRRYKFLTEADQLRLRIALQTMRMACDNTYLVDHETKHGTKVGELEILLEEIFEDGRSKVVVFSQWLRMNELVGEMLTKRGWAYVHLHGGVPTRERKHLTRRLREDKDCRVFLSTDAGGVGLNLQTASTVVNMDLPWNPAVLEQRIGRVHRLGQERPVRAVNFVSQDTIEHGMLALLAFKRSMFAGVLDGATDKIIMGDSALNRFMKTVDTTVTSIPAASTTPLEKVTASPEESGNGREKAASATPTEEAAGANSSLDAAGLAQLFVQGAQLLEVLGRTLTGANQGSGAQRSGNGLPRVVTDATSGRRELRIGLPDEGTLQQWGQLLSNVARAFDVPQGQPAGRVNG